MNEQDKEVTRTLLFLLVVIGAVVGIANMLFGVTGAVIAVVFCVALIAISMLDTGAP